MLRAWHGASLLIAVAAHSTLAQDIPAPITQRFDAYESQALKLHALLQVVQDKDSADKTASAIAAELPKLVKIQQQFAQMGRLDSKLAARLDAVYGQRICSAWGKCYEDIIRIQKAQGYQSLPFIEQFQILCSVLQGK